MISFESFDPGAWTVDGMLVKLADVEPVKAVAKKLRQSSDLMAHSLKALVIGSVLATPIATTATPLQWSRTVAAGELVQLPGRPKYLAIGTGDAELTIGITPVDVSKFVQKGTLRMGVAEFGLAEQNALGGSIPDPAEPSQR